MLLRISLFVKLQITTTERCRPAYRRQGCLSVAQVPAEVVTVYAGQELTAGQELYVCSEAWVISLYGEPKSLERNFVNIMRTGEEYLIFGSEVLEDLSGDLPAIKLNEVRFISPVFAYKEFAYVILPIGELHTYVPYSGVKDNEFFPQSPETLALWQELKADMLAAYP